jgi:hypothetical protein
LTGATEYHFWLQAADEWGRTATVDFTIPTTAFGGPTSASTSGHTILVNGQVFFPIAVWDECTDAVAAKIAQGINLFMGEGCGHEAQLPAALAGRAFAVVDAQPIAAQPVKANGVIGWFYPDELDGRLSPPLTSADVAKLALTPPAGTLSFLTLTNHFYSRAEPLPIGRAVYPTFAGLASVLGFDLYPLQNWCRPDRLGDVYDAQHELEALAGGKPTFQWIEVRQMDCSADLAPTPATVRAETWLALAGGADGIGYFPHEWSSTIGAEITTLDASVAELAPALLAEDGSATAPLPLRVGVRVLNGAVYVIAVNPTSTPVDGTIQVDGIADRTFAVRGEARSVVASNGAIADHFDAYGVHVYVSAPDGWNAG